MAVSSSDDAYTVSSAQLNCSIVRLSPSTVSASFWPVQVELTCRVVASDANVWGFVCANSSQESNRGTLTCAEWLLTASSASDDSAVYSSRVVPVSDVYDNAAGALFLKFRCEVPASAVGIASIALSPLAAAGVGPGTGTGSATLSCGPVLAVATAPLFIAPSAASSQEMLNMFSAMQHVVMAQHLEHQLNRQQPPSSIDRSALDTSTAEECWSEHFKPLLFDLQQVLLAGGSSAKQSPASAAADPVGHVFTSLLEFLAMHSCWCCVSYVLAEGYKSGLLSSAGVIAAARMKQLSISRQLGPTGFGTAAGVTSAMILALTCPGDLDSKYEFETCDPTISSRVSSKTRGSQGLEPQECHGSNVEGQVAACPSSAEDATASVPAEADRLVVASKTSSGGLASLLMVLLALLVPFIQLSPAEDAVPAAATDAAGAQLPMLYCWLLTAVFTTIAGLTAGVCR